MAKINSYSFGNINKCGCVFNDLSTLYSLLCKVACVGHPDYDFVSDWNTYLSHNPDAKDIIGDLRDMLFIALRESWK